MALYYFDVDENGTTSPDDHGTECADIGHVKQEAIRTLVDMIREVLPDGDQHTLRIKVRSEGGDLVLQVAINFQVESQRRSESRKSHGPHAEG
jgi:hypothetical protein